jgi:hypothetical protein
MRFKVIPTCVALALVGGVTFLPFSLGPREAAGAGEHDRRNAENTFTKWITALPNMAGVVGGDVGRGTYSGEILKFEPGVPSSPGVPGTPTFIEALYHFNGRTQSFTAHVYVTQLDLKAVIIGVVTDGWLQGNLVEGEYTQIQCSHDKRTTDCFRGTLDILHTEKR